MMGNSIQKWRFCHFVLVFITFSLLHVAICIPRERRGARISEHEFSKRINKPGGESAERFCLKRLQDALKVVCSGGGSSRTPLYYNPGQISPLNQSSVPVHALRGQSTNIRNNVPTMVQPQRRLLRRRARRNIVRECCETPCNFTTLWKYCSPTVRLSGSNLDPTQSKSQPTTSQKVKLGRLSRNPNIATLQDQPNNNCLGYPDCNNIPNEQAYVRPASTSQCVSIADLEHFYFKLFRKQWKKDNIGMPNNNINAAYASDSLYNNAVEELDEKSTNAYALATNQMFPNHFQNPMLTYDINDWQPSSSTTERVPISELLEDTDSGESMESIQKPNKRWPPNVITAKPITSIINFPRGTSDYIY